MGEAIGSWPGWASLLTACASRSAFPVCGPSTVRVEGGVCGAVATVGRIDCFTNQLRPSPRSLLLSWSLLCWVFCKQSVNLFWVSRLMGRHIQTSGQGSEGREGRERVHLPQAVPTSWPTKRTSLFSLFKEEPRKVCFTYDLFLNLEGNPPVNHLRCEKLTFNNPTVEFRYKLLMAGGVSAPLPVVLAWPLIVLGAPGVSHRVVRHPRP